MPPKEGKKKKTKAEIEAEKLARLEEERKAKEAEQKRLDEEAEKKRIEDERIQADRTAFRVAELERLQTEYDIFLDEKKTRASAMTAEKNHEDGIISWSKYCDPGDEPDARSEKDINTFISEITESDCSSSLVSTMDLVKRLLSVSRATENILSESLTAMDKDTFKKSKRLFSFFNDIIMKKIDEATIQMLRFCDSNLDDKGELNIEEVSGPMAVGFWATLSDVRPIRKTVRFDKIGLVIEIPKQILQQQDSRFVYRVINSPLDKFTPSAYAIDPTAAKSTPRESNSVANSDKIVVGNVLLFDILHCPQAAFYLRAKKWSIRNSSTAAFSLRPVKPYPSSVACKVTMRVPDDVIMGEDVSMAVWDEERMVWSQDGIDQFQYTESNRTAMFYLTTTGTFAFVRDRKAELPYKSWSLQAVYVPPNACDIDASEARKLLEQRARFTLETKFQKIVIDIEGTRCRLVEPNVPQFTDLIGKLLHPGWLLFELQHRGLNIIAASSTEGVDSDCSNVLEDVAPKTSDLENNVLENISLCASACDFVSSDWNQQLPSDEIGILARESTAPVSGVDVYDYDCVLVCNDGTSESCKHAPHVGILPDAGAKYLLVTGNNYGRSTLYDRQARPGEHARAELSKSLTSRLTKEALERVKRVNGRFAETVFMILRIVRPFSLS